MEIYTTLSFAFVFLFLASFSKAKDFITPSQPLKDNGDPIVSQGGQFELGFFNIGTGRYLGIRYHNFAQNVTIWVANRNTPLISTSGTLSLSSQGTLTLSISNTTSFSRNIWSSNNSSPDSVFKNPVARLLDTGNLVVGRSNIGLGFDEANVLWQSFDHPGNMQMPSMKIGRNLVTGLDRYMSSWATEKDPSQGEYTCYIDISGYPQKFVNKGSQIVARIGSWNGERFTGSLGLHPNELYIFEFLNNEKEIYYQFNLVDSKVPTTLVLTPNDGILERRLWVDKQERWIVYLKAQQDNCDTFNVCGPNGCCIVNNSPPCGCIDGFEPKDPTAWNMGDWSHGCVRKVGLECLKDGFKRIKGLKLPDTRKVVYNKNLSLKECKRLCRANCSCTAYANSDIRNGGSGCLMWFDELVDVRVSNNGQDLYVRMAASELGNGSTRRKLVSIIVPILSTGAIFFILWLILRKRNSKEKEHNKFLSKLQKRKHEDFKQTTKI